MMAKITKGASFGGAVRYILDRRKHTELLGTDGLRLKDLNSIIGSFETQRQLNPRVSQPVGHISLSFSTQDCEKLDNLKIVTIALEYMERMGIRNTQFIIGRHHDREHPHIHILYNRIDNDGHTISDQNDRLRSGAICKELTRKYGLYLASGKEHVKRERLRGRDAAKYKIYDALVKHVPHSKSWAELGRRLATEGIQQGFKAKGTTSQIEGVRFATDGVTFNGSKVDRMFSYSKIDHVLRQNQRTEQVQQQPTQTRGDQETSGLDLGLGDLFAPNPVYDSEEEAFRRRMLRKRKQKDQGFSL